MDKSYLTYCLSSGMSLRDISNDSGKARETVRYWIYKHGLEDLYTHHRGNPYYFNKIDTPEKAYALGFILADGSIAENGAVEITTGIGDKEVCDFLSGVIDSNVFTTNSINKKKKIFPKARTSKKIPDIFKFTGGRLKSERHYPRVRKDLERYLIQGFFDADGCITWGRRKDRNRIWHKISFTSQYKMLIGIQKYLLNNLNISSAVKQKSSENCYYLDFSNKSDVLKFCDHIYRDNQMIVLHRKYLKYNALRLELGENGGSRDTDLLYRAEPAEREGVETNGVAAKSLNNRVSPQVSEEFTNKI